MNSPYGPNWTISPTRLPTTGPQRAATYRSLDDVTQPTLVATGGSNDYFEEAADPVAASLAYPERQVIAGQGHVVDPEVMAAVLTRFFST
jgi:hypothetical protein